MMLTQFIHHQNGRIAYDGSGTGSLVICVPSLGDMRAEYRFLRPLLTAAGFRVVGMDVRGHGESSTDWEDFSVAAIGSDVTALVRELDAGPAIVIGTSMGAGAAIWAAAEAPDLVRGLVLVDPFVDGEGQPLLRLLFSIMFARPWGPSMWLKYYSSLYPGCKPPDMAEYSAALKANLEEPGRLEALVHMLKASKQASAERIPMVKQPALVLMGSRDPDFRHPEAEARRVGGLLQAPHVMIEGAGHYPHAESPAAAAAPMLTFMRSLEKG